MKSKEEIEQLAEKLYIEPLNKQGEQRTHTPKSGGMYGFKKFKKYFTLGYTQCQEDMSKEIKMIMETLLKIRDCKDYGNNSSTLAEELINSLNKQD